MRPPYPTERALIVETLQGLMDRLAAPDLTVAEAQDLHPRLFQLLETIEVGRYPRYGPTGDRKAGRDSGCCLAVGG
jgi:hypothetical protein